MGNPNHSTFKSFEEEADAAEAVLVEKTLDEAVAGEVSDVTPEPVA